MPDPCFNPTEEMSQNGKPSKTTSGRCDEHVPIHFAKIIILGDTGVGKTSLIKVILESILFNKIMSLLNNKFANLIDFIFWINIFSNQSWTHSKG